MKIMTTYSAVTLVGQFDGGNIVLLESYIYEEIWMTILNETICNISVSATAHINELK